MTTTLRWRKSSYSVHDDCVEVADLGTVVGTAIAVRNSRDPDGPTLTFSRPELLAFARGLASGEFDDLLEPGGSGGGTGGG
jgi:hypothetical protein